MLGDAYLVVARFDERLSDDHAFDDDRATPLVNLVAVAEIIFLLPGPSPASVRCEAARLFAQYLDGDVSAVARVEQMAHVQEHLRLRETEADVLRWKRWPAWRRCWCCGGEGGSRGTRLRQNREKLVDRLCQNPQRTRRPLLSQPDHDSV